MRQPNDRYTVDPHWARWGVWDVLEPRRVVSTHDTPEQAQAAADRLNQPEPPPPASAPTLFDKEA